MVKTKYLGHYSYSSSPRMSNRFDNHLKNTLSQSMAGNGSMKTEIQMINIQNQEQGVPDYTIGQTGYARSFLNVPKYISVMQSANETSSSIFKPTKLKTQPAVESCKVVTTFFDRQQPLAVKRPDSSLRNTEFANFKRNSDSRST